MVPMPDRRKPHIYRVNPIYRVGILNNPAASTFTKHVTVVGAKTAYLYYCRVFHQYIPETEMKKQLPK